MRKVTLASCFLLFVFLSNQVQAEDIAIVGAGTYDTGSGSWSDEDGFQLFMGMSSVPEPTSLSLPAMGGLVLGGLALVKRRRR